LNDIPILGRHSPPRVLTTLNRLTGGFAMLVAGQRIERC